MTSLAQIIQYLISGMTSGSIYAMVGLCWSIVFLVTGIVNFSTGEFVMLGGMFTWLLLGAGVGLVPAVLLAILFTILVGILMEWLVIRPVRYPSETTFMVITIAAASIIKGLTLIACGSETQGHSPAGSGETVLHSGGRDHQSDPAGSGSSGRGGHSALPSFSTVHSWEKP